MTDSLRPLDLNLLPDRYRPQRFPWWIAVAVLAIAGLLVGLTPVYDAYGLQMDMTHLARSDVDALQTALAGRQVGFEELEALDQQITAAQLQLALLEDQVTFLRGQQDSRTHGITAAVEALTWVPRLTLHGIALDGQHLTLAGSAGSQDLVLDYARALQDGGAFRNVQIASMTDQHDPGALPLVEFVLVAEQ